MTTATWVAWVGGIAGGLIGLGGAILGTWVSVRNTRGPRERAFMVKAVAVAWVGGLVFLGLLLGLPDPYRWFVWLPYAVLLPLGIVYGNRRHRTIRETEAREEQPDDAG